MQCTLLIAQVCLNACACTEIPLYVFITQIHIPLAGNIYMEAHTHLHCPGVHKD